MEARDRHDDHTKTASNLFLKRTNRLTSSTSFMWEMDNYLCREESDELVMLDTSGIADFKTIEPRAVHLFIYLLKHIYTG